MVKEDNSVDRKIIFAVAYESDPQKKYYYLKNFCDGD